MAISCDPSSLVKAAKCFQCVPKSARRWVKNYLLCQIASSGVMSVPQATGLIGNTVSSTLIRLRWVPLPAGITSTNVYTSTDGVNFFPVTSVAAPGTGAFIAAGAVVGQIQYIKIQWCIGSRCGAFSSTVRVPGATADWASRVLANGGAATAANTLAALDAFWLNLNDNGLIANLVAVNVFAPDNLTAAITPFIKSLGNDPWTNNNFVAGDLTINGLKGDAATKYLDCGFQPQNITDGGLNKQDGGFALYCAEAYNVATAADDFGSYNLGATVSTELSFSNGANNLSWAGGNYGTSFVVASNAGPFLGFLLGTTKGAAPAHNTLYKANSVTPWAQIATNANTNGGLSPTNCVIFARNQNGVIAGFTSRRLSFAAAFRDMTSAQGQNLFNAVQTLRTSFGGGFA